MEERMAQWAYSRLSMARVFNEEALEACAQDFGKVILSDRPWS